MKYVSCDVNHRPPYKADCKVCHKNVDLGAPHYVTTMEGSRFAVHVECVVADKIAEGQ